ncbi:MAG: ATP-binding protein [Pyrobaculum sp.]
MTNVELYVKKALTVVEHPPIEVGRVFVVITSSEGASLDAVGRHMWANVKTLWNLARDGFRELIGQTKLDADFEKLWRATGGNPRAVEMLDEEGVAS